MARFHSSFGVTVAVVCLAAGRAGAAPVCGSVAEFNGYMSDHAATSDDVTLTFDVVGVNPADFHNGKGALAQMRNTTCKGGAQDAVIKVYGTSDPLNTAHPPGTLKMEYGNQCCAAGTCGELWAEPNASAVVFANGSEQCKVTMWVKPASIGYKLECGSSTFDGLGGNPEKNVVNQVAVLEYLLTGGGSTWEISNAKASNVQVCYTVTGTPTQTLTVPVLEDVTVGPSYPTTVFPDVGDLAVEAADNQAYLKFVVPASVGKVTQARLVMHTRTEASSNGSGGEVYPVANHQWSESTLTWNARPTPGATSLGRIGPAAIDESVSLDLGSAISGPGTYSFAVVSPATDTNGTHFFSKEGSATAGPRLLLTYQGGGASGGGGAGGGGSGSGGQSGSGGWGATTSGGAAGAGVDPGVENEPSSDSGCALGARSRGIDWWLAAVALVVLRRRRAVRA
ncbi:MAG: DNRLRE domain-containing protein [Polyangiaceae bacterium]|nr:DNRLRE domain-containing protein [Polyangiaceae bacterium]